MTHPPMPSLRDPEGRSPPRIPRHQVRERISRLIGIVSLAAEFGVPFVAASIMISMIDLPSTVSEPLVSVTAERNVDARSTNAIAGRA